MNIAILGSSFDPPHNGHISIAKSILKSQIAQKVILMPACIHPFAKKMTLSHHRLKMVKLLEEDNIQVSDLEIRKKSISYSIKTLKTLQKQFPKDHFYWIIGSDNIYDFKKWKNWQEIIEKFGLIIVPRRPMSLREAKNERRSNPKNEEIASLPSGARNDNIFLLNSKIFTPINISSTEIRKRVKEGKSISFMVPKEVEEYIIKHKLYK